MAGNRTGKAVQGGGEQALFDAIEALTWREMHSAAGLIALQLEGSGYPSPEAVAKAMADAAESFAAEED